MEKELDRVIHIIIDFYAGIIHQLNYLTTPTQTAIN